MNENSDRNPILEFEDDGLHTPSIKEHSLRKIRLHNYYVTLFSTAMKNKWPQRAYLGLYSGAGRARVTETGKIVATTAVSALAVADPFTKYIFVDNNRECIAALKARASALDKGLDVSFIKKDVSTAVPAITKAMPSFSKNRGLLSFCFVDPFSAELDFSVFKELGSQYKMDFLVLLMLGRDVRTNFRRYLEDENDTRIAKLIDDENWREEWADRGYQARNVVRFMLDKFNQAMERVGYSAVRPDDAHPIRLLEKNKNVLLYYLVLYSKHPLGRAFWDATRRGTDEQLSLL
ncbi:MAG: three-Cys-motif partner protein TcmP [Gemmatimonadetes bacterium]|nr:three-Cys-motif partner protein TcmP [Caldilineaceae bacterium SB0665_bin_25]MYC91068.1 three-Cys-motif partner protein TcmP [Gemmatimonadota bacterium]MYG35325.1 three-Cys-motif partner protein TcmP [Gemmatimonadota bacterium]